MLVNAEQYAALQRLGRAAAPKGWGALRLEPAGGPVELERDLREAREDMRRSLAARLERHECSPARRGRGRK